MVEVVWQGSLFEKVPPSDIFQIVPTPRKLYSLFEDGETQAI